MRETPSFQGRFHGKYVQREGGHKRLNKLAAGMSATSNRSGGQIDGDALTLCVNGTTDKLGRWLNYYTVFRRDKICPCCQQTVTRRELRPHAYRRLAQLRQDRANRDASNAPKIAAALQEQEAEAARLAIFSAPGFSLTRRPCRERLAAIVAELARAKGAVVEVSSRAGTLAKWVDVEIIAARGLGLLLPIHSPGRMKSEAICLHWHVDVDSEARLSDAVAWQVNQFHRCKATDIAYGPVALCNLLATRLDQINSGIAFQGD